MKLISSDNNDHLYDLNIVQNKPIAVARINFKNFKPTKNHCLIDARERSLNLKLETTVRGNKLKGNSYKKVLILNIPFLNIYCHCLFDVIPKLMYADQNTDYDIIFTKDSSLLQKFISIFNIQLTKTFFVRDESPDIKIITDELVIENHPTFYIRELDKISLLKNKIDQYVDQNIDKSKISNRLIYCTRNSGKGAKHGRRIEENNEKEIVSILENFCKKNQLVFTLFSGENEQGDTMTIEQQIKLFSEAKIVVGPHGGAMVNILYLSKNNNCKICEFCNTSQSNYIFNVKDDTEPFIKNYNFLTGNIMDECTDYYLLPIKANKDLTTSIDIDNLKHFLNEIDLQK